MTKVLATILAGAVLLAPQQQRPTFRTTVDLVQVDVVVVDGSGEQVRGLTQADNDTVLNALVAEPRLIERPLVETAKGVRLCRPPERVEEIL